MRILFAGDVVGRAGRRAVAELYPDLKRKHKIDLFIVNGENAAGGSGLTSNIVKDLHDFGVDVITSGDHVWKQKDVLNIIDKDTYLLRPANYPDGSPGRGSTVINSSSGIPVGIINVLGRIFMQPIDCPFKAVTREIEKISSQTRIIIVDVHAEATSEKIAMGWYLDGKVTAAIGTHTHVQTADETVLPGGTAYITDVGMTGPFESVLGREVKPVLKRFITQMPSYFTVASGDIRLAGAGCTARKPRPPVPCRYP